MGDASTPLTPTRATSPGKSRSASMNGCRKKSRTSVPSAAPGSTVTAGGLLFVPTNDTLVSRARFEDGERTLVRKTGREHEREPDDVHRKIRKAVCGWSLWWCRGRLRVAVSRRAGAIPGFRPQNSRCGLRERSCRASQLQRHAKRDASPAASPEWLPISRPQNWPVTGTH